MYKNRVENNRIFLRNSMLANEAIQHKTEQENSKYIPVILNFSAMDFLVLIAYVFIQALKRFFPLDDDDVMLVTMVKIK